MARTYSSANNPSVSNRWVIAIAAVFLQLALGAVYAWSVFLKPVQDLYHVSKPEANLTFTITLIALGVTASFGGYFQSRFGPRTIATVGGILYGVGVFLSGFMPSLFLLYLTYGIIGGIGLGLGYIVPLAMLIKWFPDRRGFITGLAVAGFGAGAAFTGPLATELIKNIGVQTTFIYLGIIYLVITVVAAQFFRPAPANYTPPGWTPSPTQQATSANRDYTFGEALRNPKWYILWLILALNVTAGAALISVASPLAQDFAKIDATTASVIVITISIFNGVGRLFWAWLSDSIGRPFTFLAIFLVQVIVFPILANSSAFPLILVLAAIIGLCYGGGFGTMPAFAADFFGPKNVGMIYGAMLTAWSAGAIVGPILISVADYRTALYIIAGIVLVSAVLPLITRMMINREKAALSTGTGSGPRGEPA
jgi:OFA family oxalate/formate antiporter-like MFS transporter